MNYRIKGHFERVFFFKKIPLSKLPSVAVTSAVHQVVHTLSPQDTWQDCTLWPVKLRWSQLPGPGQRVVKEGTYVISNLEYLLTQDFLGQHFPTELSVTIEMPHICLVQYGSQ